MTIFRGHTWDFKEGFLKTTLPRLITNKRQVFFPDLGFLILCERCILKIPTHNNLDLKNNGDQLEQYGKEKFLPLCDKCSNPKQSMHSYAD